MPEPKILEGELEQVAVQPTDLSGLVWLTVADDANPVEETTVQLWVFHPDERRRNPEWEVVVNGSRADTVAQLVAKLLEGHRYWRVKVWDYGGYVGCARAEFSHKD